MLLYGENLVSNQVIKVYSSWNKISNKAQWIDFSKSILVQIKVPTN